MELITEPHQYRVLDPIYNLMLTDEGEYIKLPHLLWDYLSATKQLENAPLSLRHLLHESERQLHFAYKRPGSTASKYHHNSKLALKRFAIRLRNRGITPELDYDIKNGKKREFMGGPLLEQN